jgi:methylated-DNA-[protein]-cysteine S-methyltransferase
MSTPSTDEEAMRAAREALAQRASAEDTVDITYAVTDSPVGRLLVAVTSVGVLRIAFEREHHDEVLSSLANRISARILQSATHTDHIRRELDEYFAGTRAAFTLTIDWALVAGFQRSILDAANHLLYGSTVSYAEIASAAGNSKAVRAAGTALGKNPIPIVIPCHRILRANGTLGGYLGGTEAKALLIETERTHRHQLVDG